MQTKATSVRAPEEVFQWRCDRLMESGFARALAAAVAEDQSYDLHALIELVERGCRPELAVRILATFDQESAA